MALNHYGARHWRADHFDAVWFAPADEGHLTPAEIAPEKIGGVQLPGLLGDEHISTRRRRRVIPFPAPAQPVEDDEALLLAGIF